MENLELKTELGPMESATNGGEVTQSESLEVNTETTNRENRIRAYTEKRANRIERLRFRASKKVREGEGLLKRAGDIASFIPSGQPILIGHHSEGRHRRDLNRIHNWTKKGLDSIDMAKDLQSRADYAENNDAILTDDPQAGEKLAAKIAKLEKQQAMMKEVNKRIRMGKGLGDLGISESGELKLKQPDFMGRNGFPDYLLKNNNANIRRLKERALKIRKVESLPVPEPIERNGIRLVENVEENRVQIFFPGKPDETVRTQLKRSGFRWSPFNGCWQRHRSFHATQLAQGFLEIKAPD